MLDGVGVMQQEVRYEVMVPKCAIQKNNGENFTSQEINVFLDDFCDWLERRGVDNGWEY